MKPHKFLEGVPLTSKIYHWIYENLRSSLSWLGGVRTPVSFGQLRPCTFRILFLSPNEHLTAIRGEFWLADFTLCS